MANFDSIIPGMAAGRYDMTVSSMTPTTQAHAGPGFRRLPAGRQHPCGAPRATRSGSTKHSLCGKKVGFLIASYQLTINVPEYDEECAAAGQDPIQTSEFQDTRQAISALTSGRQDAVLADSPILDFAVTQNPDDRDRLARTTSPRSGLAWRRTPV